MRALSTIFDVLLAAYGKQGWWPVTPPGGTGLEYSGGPKNDLQRFEVMVGAVLTQNTSWKNVEKALAVLHQRKLMDVDSIRRIPAAKLAAHIRSSGYYNEKAKKLKALADFLHGAPIDTLRTFNTAELRRMLLSVHGIGPETADSILLYALDRPIFVIDAYTKRIFARLGLAPQGADYQLLQDLFHDSLPRRRSLFKEYHALLVQHGKDVCKRRPVCGACPLARTCPKILESLTAPAD